MIEKYYICVVLILFCQTLVPDASLSLFKTGTQLVEIKKGKTEQIAPFWAKCNWMVSPVARPRWSR